MYARHLTGYFLRSQYFYVICNSECLKKFANPVMELINFIVIHNLREKTIKD